MATHGIHLPPVRTGLAGQRYNPSLYRYRLWMASQSVDYGPPCPPYELRTQDELKEELQLRGLVSGGRQRQHIDRIVGSDREVMNYVATRPHEEPTHPAA